MIQQSTLSNIIYITEDDFNIQDLLEIKSCEELATYISPMNYDFIFFWGKNEDYLFNTLPNKKKKRVLIWCGEESSIFPSSKLFEEFSIIFKEYLNDNYPKNNKLFPLPLLTPDKTSHSCSAIKPIKQRKFNLFFSGNLNYNRFELFYILTPQKTLIDKFCNFLIKKKIKGSNYLFKKIYLQNKTINLSNLNKKQIINFTNKFNSGFSPEKYINYLSDSQIVLSPRGFHSAECFRLYEAIQRGCIVITEKLPNHSFYQNIPAIQVNTWSDLLNIDINNLINNFEAENIHKFYQDNLSVQAIANYIKLIIQHANIQ